jgi:hypothetical protein
MTMHYQGTPITPIAALYELAGRCFYGFGIRCALSQ